MNFIIKIFFFIELKSEFKSELERDIEGKKNYFDYNFFNNILF
jgi:hypothetical protein